MSNDPDVIYRPCPHCDGDGGSLQDIYRDEEGSVWIDCAACGGSGDA